MGGGAIVDLISLALEDISNQIKSYLSVSKFEKFRFRISANLDISLSPKARSFYFAPLLLAQTSISCISNNFLHGQIL